MIQKIIYAICAQCANINRVPGNRVQDSPRCGKCKNGLFPAQPVELTNANAANLLNILQQPAIIDCWATWCGPCQSMAPLFAQAAALRPDIHFLKLDVDQAASAASNFHIRSVPTLILWANGHEISRISGVMPAAELSRWIDTQLIKAGA